MMAGVMLIMPFAPVVIVWVVSAVYYYHLAHQQEEQLTVRYGDLYTQYQNEVSMFIPGTNTILKALVRQTISIFGQSVPLSEVTISVHSEVEHFVKRQSDETGAYLLNFDTSILEMGQHATKSKVAKEVPDYRKAVSEIIKTISPDLKKFANAKDLKLVEYIENLTRPIEDNESFASLLSRFGDFDKKTIDGFLKEEGGELKPLFMLINNGFTNIDHYLIEIVRPLVLTLLLFNYGGQDKGLRKALNEDLKSLQEDLQNESEIPKRYKALTQAVAGLVCYIKGRENKDKKEENLEAAAQFLEDARQNECILVLPLLAEFCVKAVGGVNKDYERAIALCKSAIKKGLPLEQEMMADLYQECGADCEKKYRKHILTSIKIGDGEAIKLKKRALECHDVATKIYHECGLEQEEKYLNKKDEDDGIEFLKQSIRYCDKAILNLSIADRIDSQPISPFHKESRYQENIRKIRENAAPFYCKYGQYLAGLAEKGEDVTKNQEEAKRCYSSALIASEGLSIGDRVLAQKGLQELLGVQPSSNPALSSNPLARKGNKRLDPLDPPKGR
jgi:TPR repeat protein